jgi:hypothetical protein
VFKRRPPLLLLLLSSCVLIMLAQQHSRSTCVAAPSLLPAHILLQVLPEQHAAFDAFGSSSSAMAEEGVLMDGFAPPAGAMYAMFPDEAEPLQQDWDAYGAALDTTELRKTDGELICVSVGCVVCLMGDGGTLGVR